MVSEDWEEVMRYLQQLNSFVVAAELLNGNVEDKGLTITHKALWQVSPYSDHTWQGARYYTQSTTTRGFVSRSQWC